MFFYQAKRMEIANSMGSVIIMILKKLYTFTAYDILGLDAALDFLSIILHT
jgi:hypothetical protein